MSDLDEVTVEPAEGPVASETLPSDIKAFSYPTLGDGVTIWAKDQADADAQAAAHPLNPKNQ